MSVESVQAREHVITPVKVTEGGEGTRNISGIIWGVQPQMWLLMIKTTVVHNIVQRNAGGSESTLTYCHIHLEHI